mmetsp:Transcript_2784/g.8556  ORF Transcript_2784/g.8556 Transcript_2784/m.8556 type:complete len:288 (-) Transcript_2784:299-1162(-)
MQGGKEGPRPRRCIAGAANGPSRLALLAAWLCYAAIGLLLLGSSLVVLFDDVVQVVLQELGVHPLVEPLAIGLRPSLYAQWTPMYHSVVRLYEPVATGCHGHHLALHLVIPDQPLQRNLLRATGHGVGDGHLELGLGDLLNADADGLEHADVLPEERVVVQVLVEGFRDRYHVTAPHRRVHVSADLDFPLRHLGDDWSEPLVLCDPSQDGDVRVILVRGVERLYAEGVLEELDEHRAVRLPRAGVVGVDDHLPLLAVPGQPKPEPHQVRLPQLLLHVGLHGELELLD